MSSWIPFWAGVVLAIGPVAPAAHGEEAARRLDAQVALGLERAVREGWVPASGGNGVAVQMPQREVFELGAVVNFGQGGGEVLAVTPSGAAHRMGLERGDRLLSLNGRELDSASASVVDEALNATGGSVVMEVLRDGERVSLAGNAQRTVIPGYTLAVQPLSEQTAGGCGRINQSLTPPISEEIHPLVVESVNGAQPGPVESEVYRLRAGRHVLMVSEAIRDDRFTGNQNRKRRGLFRQEALRRFTLDVAPDTTYRLGARLVRDNREDIRGGSYWEPVVWAQFQENCR